MNFHDEIPRHNIIVLAHSVPWCSAIRRNFSDARLSWVLSIDGLLEEALGSQATAAIVEFPNSNIDEICKKLNPLANNSLQLKLFAVGNDDLLPWRPLFRAIGIAGCYWSLLQIPELVREIRAHALATPPRDQSIEQRVTASLPWPTAAAKDQA